MNTVELAYGQILPNVKDAKLNQVGHQKLPIFTILIPLLLDTELKDGFRCPTEAQTDANGQIVAHPKYAHPTDCQRFYVCLNGQEPRDLGCIAGEVYNEETQRCDAPENVPGW